MEWFGGDDGVVGRLHDSKDGTKLSKIMEIIQG